ncbi:unnamed protein product, partial [Choristocarpus tenellus]
QGEEGKKIQELLFDELWKETIRQMRSMEVSEMTMNKYLKQTQQHTFGILVQYDHAYTLEDEEEMLDSLAGALWRGVFMRSSDGVTEEHVRTLAKYVQSEHEDMMNAPQDKFLDACIEFAPPPRWGEMPAQALETQKQKGGKQKPAPRVRGLEMDGVATKEAVLTEAPVATENMLCGGGEVEGGRWRACLAESGKVCWYIFYYYH